MNELLRKLLFLPPQVSTLARDVDYLHYFVMIVTMVMSVLIGSLAVYYMVKYRRKKEHEHTPWIEAPFWAEVIFVSVPLVFFLLWFRIGYGQFIQFQNPPKDALDIYVMGKKWMWKFAYPEGPNGLSTVRVPAGRPVRLLMTSRDVIHSFFVPALRAKQDVLPGRYTQLWFKADLPGVYPVFCTEYCGTGHSIMRAEIIVMEPDAYEKWIADQRGRVAQADTRPAEAGREQKVDLVEEGRRVAAEQGCLKCHTVDGSPHIGPTWLDMYGRREKLASGKTIVVDDAYITESMMNPRADVVAGYPTVMPSFQGKISSVDTAAVVEYIRSLRSYTDEEAPSKPAFLPAPGVTDESPEVAPDYQKQLQQQAVPQPQGGAAPAEENQ